MWINGITFYYSETSPHDVLIFLQKVLTPIYISNDDGYVVNIYYQFDIYIDTQNNWFIFDHSGVGEFLIPIPDKLKQSFENIKDVNNVLS